MYQVIDGKKISQEIKDELKEKAAAMAKEGKKVALAVIQVGNDPASSVYVRNKKKACEYIGIESLSYELPEETTEEELVALIEKLNADAVNIGGIHARHARHFRSRSVIAGNKGVIRHRAGTAAVNGMSLCRTRDDAANIECCGYRKRARIKGIRQIGAVTGGCRLGMRHQTRARE